MLVAQLMLAAYHGHAGLVKLLLDHGADPNRLNDRGQSPLAGAVFKMEDAVVEVGFFWSACRRGTDNWQTLLDGGADPELGAPSALDCISMFNQSEKWEKRFQMALGRPADQA